MVYVYIALGVVAYTGLVLLIAKFAGFNQLDKDDD